MLVKNCLFRYVLKQIQYMQEIVCFGNHPNSEFFPNAMKFFFLCGFYYLFIDFDSFHVGRKRGEGTEQTVGVEVIF